MALAAVIASVVYRKLRPDVDREEADRFGREVAEEVEGSSDLSGLESGFPAMAFSSVVRRARWMGNCDTSCGLDV